MPRKSIQKFMVLNCRLFVLLGVVLLGACGTDQEPNYQIIPVPDQIQFGTGYVKDIKAVVSEITYEKVPRYAEEQYQLIINDDVLIRAGSERGRQRALASIAQLKSLNNGKLPKCTIDDQPRFSYRGMHLDVARHFFKVDDVKKYIDYLHYYKFNTFHWHLTEDQGWRIEIKKYPNLQSIAAYRDETLIGHYSDQPHQFDGVRYGGFYTQEEVKEVVAYAMARGIDVIPEIEMPGHSLAALTAYPELGCGDGPYKVATKWGVFDDVYCPTEVTFGFLEDVIDEIIHLFPSKYIHIGGDECPKTAWKNSSFCQQMIKELNLKDEHGLQSYFIQRMEKYINSKGKQIIGWDEILEGGLAPNATVMSWRGEAGGIEAANQNHNVVMTPTTYCYFDYYQSDRPDEPLAIGGYLPVEKVYGWDPIPEELEDEKHQYILGGQGNVWTEYMKTFDKVEYMALNRMIALSEVLWSSRKGSFEEFKPRFATHLDYWKKEGVNIADHLLDLKAIVHHFLEKGSYMQFDEADEVYVQFEEEQAQRLKGAVHYFNEEGTYKLYKREAGKQGNPVVIHFDPHLGTKARVELESDPHRKYAGNGPTSLINGIKGSNEKYGDQEWLGFSGEDCKLKLKWDEAISIDSITFRLFNGEGQWIYLPREIRVTADSGSTFSVTDIAKQNKVVTSTLPLGGLKTKTLDILIKNYGTIPDGKQGAGHEAWLFVDEIEIR